MNVSSPLLLSYKCTHPHFWWTSLLRCHTGISNISQTREPSFSPKHGLWPLCSLIRSVASPWIHSPWFFPLPHLYTSPITKSYWFSLLNCSGSGSLPPSTATTLDWPHPAPSGPSTTDWCICKAELMLPLGSEALGFIYKVLFSHLQPPPQHWAT